MYYLAFQKVSSRISRNGANNAIEKKIEVKEDKPRV